VHITFSGVNELRRKEAGVEVKWDANRDPSQKFAGKLTFEHPQTLVYVANATATYPGRNVVASALFSFVANQFDSGLHLEWSPIDVIDISAGASYRTGNITEFKASSQLLTPFEGWKRTSLSAL